MLSIWNVIYDTSAGRMPLIRQIYFRQSLWGDGVGCGRVKYITSYRCSNCRFILYISISYYLFRLCAPTCPRRSWSSSSRTTWWSWCRTSTTFSAMRLRPPPGPRFTYLRLVYFWVCDGIDIRFFIIILHNMRCLWFAL